MDRIIPYPGQIPTDTMFLSTNKNTMIGLAYLAQSILGSSTVVDGLACTPTGPAGMTVNVATGSIYSLAQIDATAYGSLNADTTDQIMKQGIVIGTTNMSCPAPGTTGQSVVYLVEAAFQETDGGSTVLPYYNATTPSVPYSGPANSGTAQNTLRQGQCVLQLKTGVAATTGTQTTPTPDAGFTGLWAITVANGQTTITSGNIAQLSTAPFISPKLTGIIAAVQAGAANYAADTSVSANTITIALNPVVGSLTAGLRALVKVANTNTGATVINTNALGNVAVKFPNGTAFSGGELTANGLYSFIYDGSNWQFQNAAPSAVNTYYGGTTGGSANIQTLATVTPTGFTLAQGKAIFFNAGFTNTGATTLAVNSTTATSIKIDTGSGLVALTGGELISGDDYVAYYDGTQYVLIDPSSLAFLNSPALTGTPTAPTPTGTDNSTKIATTAFVAGNFAPLASPSLTGSPTAPTATVNDNTTKLATTAYADRAATNAKAYVGGNFSETGAVATGTGTFTLNDTIPVNTNGDQYMSVTYTPTNSSNKLIIDVFVQASNSSSGTQSFVGLFQDSNANALAAITSEFRSNAIIEDFAFRHQMTAGTTSSTTFKVRVGASGGTTTFNGLSSARIFGGALASSIRVTEVTS